VRLWIALFALLAAISSGQSLKVGEPAPALTLERTIPAGMTALKGKPAVLEFWATWCGDCVAEIPHLNELVAKFSGIQFLSISDEPASAVLPFLAKQPVHGWVGLDRAGATFKAYLVEARPQTMLIDKDGILRGMMHPEQVDDAVLSDLVAGRPLKPNRLSAHLHILEDTSSDPIFALLLRPSSKPKPGGLFGIDPGRLQGDNLFLRTIIAAAYSTGERHLEGFEHLMTTRYDFCVLLPNGLTGERDLLRELLERSFKLKVRHEPREMDALVLKLTGTAPQEYPGGYPMTNLVGSLEYRLNRMVVNETGFTGSVKSPNFPDKSEDLAVALKAQLGMELSSERRAVDMLVIESLELPTIRVNIPGRP
jgi:thiol-disulfide isomerase/thioredoxin